MIYDFNGRKINIPDKEIDSLVNIGMSIQEAIETCLDDRGITHNAEQEASVEASKEIGRHYENSGKKRKKADKPRKIDEEKREILAKIAENMPENAENIVIITETCIDFTLNGTNYTLKLTKHRPK